MNAQERSELLESLLAGDISESDFLRIEAELTVDASVRREFYRRLQFDQLLENESTANQLATNHRPSHKHSRWVALFVGVAVSWVGVAWLGGTWLGGTWLGGISTGGIGTGGPFSKTPLASSQELRSQEIRSQELRSQELRIELPSSPITDPAATDQGTTGRVAKEQSARGFGLIAGQSDAVWWGDAVATGTLLTDGDMKLRSGLVRLELFSGVNMVIEGEADFRIDSPMQLTLRRGKARARVPEPAKGFRIKTTMGDVIDLGTEFAVDASEKSSRVEVVEGEIELHRFQSDQSPVAQRLEPGTMVSWSADGGYASRASLDATSVAAIGPTEFEALADRRHRDRIQRWQSHRDDWLDDDRLVAWYHVEPDQPSRRQIANRARSAGPIASEGAVVASQRMADRWGRESGSFSFSPMGSRIRVNVPGEHRGLTMLCWVKLNRLDRLYNSLFLTDGHEEREPHWQIMQDGRLFFSVKRPVDSPDGPTHLPQKVYYSPPVMDPIFDNRWTLLAVTYDVDRRTVTHHVNGTSVSRETIAEPDLIESIRIGAASIGNWNEPMYRTDPTFVVRNLNGCLDEFALFTGALTDGEIQNIFELGNPE